MKQLVCDFCDSLRLGFKAGFREYRKVFEQTREVRRIVKADNFLDHPIYKVSDRSIAEDAKVQDVRELAQKNYDIKNSV